MRLVEMSDYTLAPIGSGEGIRDFSFILSTGDVVAIDAEKPDDAHLFIRSLATLIRPTKGIFKYKGRQRDLNGYRDTLSYKRKIGYIAPYAALISNLTVRQNLMIHRYYYENNLAIDMDDHIRSLCRKFGIYDKLDSRPAELNNMETKLAIVTREIAKKPELLLLDQPEDFTGHVNFDTLSQLFQEWIAKHRPVVFLSYDKRLIRRFANRKIVIANGSLTTIDL